MEVNRVGAVTPIVKPNYASSVYRAQKAQAPAQIKDKLDVRNSTQSFQAALDAARASTDVRTDKVNEISAKISSGEFQIDSRTIARRILSQVDF